MTNLTFDGVELVTRPITLVMLDCGHDTTVPGHVAKGAELECPEHCETWTILGSFADLVVPTFVAENITIA